VKAADWRRLVGGWPAADKDKLQELLQAADKVLAKMAEGCNKARATLADLLRQLG
jgi:hypothetical protein